MQRIEFQERELPYEINEEIKQLRTNIQFSGADKKVIMITSTLADEGKSSVALELCCSLAELGKKVLLIDADMRKSVLNEQTIPGAKADKGLSHLLSGQESLERVLYSTNFRGVYVIFAGHVPPNPAELLAGRNMRQLMDGARQQFDYIIVDCPPVSLVTDAAVIAPLCDGAIVVVKAEAIPRKMAANTVKILERTEVPILGVVLNQVNTKRHGYYYNRYYSKYYKKYGYGYYK